jgi:dTDP-4-amino-4,6-dideoxygalactose transaminase
MDFIPFAKPTIDEATIQSVTDVFRSGWLATGPNVAAFEKELAQYLCGEKPVFVKAFTSATGCLEIALRVMGVGPGDEVIVPAMTFAASANVIELCGATPVIVDVDFETRNLTLENIKKAVTEKTKAIMPVHFAGLSVDMDPILEFARSKNIRVIEDAAHAIGSTYKGRKIGSFGDMVSFSFHPNKNMTTIEGGALVLWDADEAKKVDQFRFHGIQKDATGNIDVLFPSGKFNMPDVSAAVGRQQLKHLDDFNYKRRELTNTYYTHLQHDLIQLPVRGDEGHSWHMFAPLIDFEKAGMTRDEFIKAMGSKKIGVGVHYPSLSELTAYKNKSGTQKCPNAEKIGRQTVTLPLFPLLTVSDIERVCAEIKSVLG